MACEKKNTDKDLFFPSQLCRKTFSLLIRRTQLDLGVALLNEISNLLFQILLFFSHYGKLNTDKGCSKCCEVYINMNMSFVHCLWCYVIFRQLQYLLFLWVKSNIYQRTTYQPTLAEERDAVSEIQNVQVIFSEKL